MPDDLDSFEGDRKSLAQDRDAWEGVKGTFAQLWDGIGQLKKKLSEEMSTYVINFNYNVRVFFFAKLGRITKIVLRQQFLIKKPRTIRNPKQNDSEKAKTDLRKRNFLLNLKQNTSYCLKDKTLYIESKNSYQLL